MPVSIKAEALIFAIHAGMKLSDSIQKAATIKIIGEDLALPPFRFDIEPNEGEAQNFFLDTNIAQGGAQFLTHNRTLEKLHQKSIALGLVGEERQLYVQFYKEYRTVLQELYKETRKEGISHDEKEEIVNRYELLAPMYLVQQWGANEATQQRKTALQLVAGTLLELGIDYFRQVPGIVQPNSPSGRALMHFLTAFDRIPFADRASFKANSQFILPKLFVAAAESLQDLSSDITRDPNLQQLLEAAGQGIAQDVYDILENLPADMNAEEVVQWGQIMLRSLIANGAGHVVNNAASVLDTNQGASDLIHATGTAFLEAILPNNNSTVDLRNAFSVASLDRMMGAALQVVSEHPELINGKEGFRDFVTDLATSLQNASVGQDHLLPELARIILERTSGHVELLWGQGTQPGEAKHLLLSATQQILEALSTQPANGGWRPKVSDDQLLGMVTDLLDEVVLNPAWITDGIDSDSALRRMLDEIFAALADIPPAHRFSNEVVELIIQLSFRSIATSNAMLSTVKWGNSLEETTIVNKALDLVFAGLFRSQDGPQVNRAELLADLLDYVLLVLLNDHPDAKGLNLLQLILFENEVVDYSQGFNRELTDSLVESGLAVLSAAPDLVSNDQVFQQLISDLSSALSQYGWKDSNLLAKVLRLVLLSTAENADLIVGANTNQPRFLLTLVLQELLGALAEANANDHWSPSLSGDQLLDLLELLLDEVVMHPYWIPAAQHEDNLLRQLLDSILAALASIPSGERLHPDTFGLLVELCVNQVATHPKLLERVRLADDAIEKSIIEQVLDIVFDAVFAKGNYPPAQRASLLIDLLEYVFELILAKYPNENGLQMVGLVLQEANLDWSQGFDQDKADSILFAAIEIFAEYPHLLGHQTLLRDMAAQVAQAVIDSGIERPDLIPEVIKLTFGQSAEALSRVINESSTGVRFLLAVAAQQILRAWSQDPRRGRWKPQLSDSQLLELLDLLLHKAMQHPSWINRGGVLPKLINAILRALEKVPHSLPLPYEVLYNLILDCLDTVSVKKEWAVDIIQPDGSHRRIALEYALEEILLVIYEDENRPDASWTLSQPEFIETLLEYYLLALTGKAVTQASVDDLRNRLDQILDNLHAEGRLLLEELEEELASEVDA